MASDLNVVTIVGRPTRDPEVRNLPNGDPVAAIRLAFSTPKRGSDGSWGDQSNYIDVNVFGRQAEVVEKWVTKGKRIGVHGSLRWREWQAQDGSKRQSVDILARDIFFLDSMHNGAGAGDSGFPDDAPAAKPVDDSDVPF